MDGEFLPTNWMKLRVRTLSIDPCGCGFEGSIRFQLVDVGTEIACSYISKSDEVVAETYQVGEMTDAPVFLAFGAIKRTTKCTPSLSPTVVGRFAGWLTVDGDKYGIVDGIVRILVDNELGEGMHDLSLGDWVECTGELTLGR
jgi:hypothetical protein